MAVESPEPLRLFRVNYSIVLPLPQAKVRQSLESVRLIFIFDCVFVVQFWKEDGLFVEASKVPPGPEVISWSNPVLQVHKFSDVANKSVEWVAVPVLALLVRRNALVGSTEREERMHVQAWTALN